MRGFHTWYTQCAYKDPSSDVWPAPLCTQVWASRHNKDPYTELTRDELEALSRKHQQAEFAQFQCDHIFEVQLANACFNLALYDEGPVTAPQPWHSTIANTWDDNTQRKLYHKPFAVMLNKEENLCMTQQKVNLNKKDPFRNFLRYYTNGLGHSGDYMLTTATYYLHQGNSEFYKRMGLVLPQVARSILFEVNMASLSLIHTRL